MQDKYIKRVLMDNKDKIYAIGDTGGVIIDNEEIILLGDTQVFSK